MLPFLEPFRGSVNVLTHHFGSCFTLGFSFLMSVISVIAFTATFQFSNFYCCLLMYLYHLDLYFFFLNPSNVILVKFGNAMSRNLPNFGRCPPTLFLLQLHSN